MAKDSKQRFSDRVQHYIKYRPDYPTAVTELLQARAGLSRDTVVADIGSGTGIFTRHLLNLGSKVFAIEPNEEMRHAADALLKEYPNYTSVDGSALNTTLKAQSIDLIVCAQAFHWFNTPETRNEFKRILKNTGYVALIWNNRIIDSDDFAKAYDQLLREKSTDYKEVNHQNLSPADFAAFFRNGEYEKTVFPNVQEFEEEGLIGRARSSSYVPSADTAEGQLFLRNLQEIFKQHQQQGTIKFQYHTEIYLGRL